MSMKILLCVFLSPLNCFIFVTTNKHIFTNNSDHITNTWQVHTPVEKGKDTMLKLKFSETQIQNSKTFHMQDLHGLYCLHVKVTIIYNGLWHLLELFAS